MVYALCNDKKYSKLFSGGADGKIIIWDSKLNKL